jgi:hypothetical protein
MPSNDTRYNDICQVRYACSQTPARKTLHIAADEIHWGEASDAFRGSVRDSEQSEWRMSL